MLQYSNGDFSDRIRYSISQLVVMIFFPMVWGIGLLLWGIIRVTHGDAEGSFWVLVGTSFCLLSLCFYLMYGYKCTISELGVMVKYRPLGENRLHTWDEFQRVCICYDMDYTKELHKELKEHCPQKIVDLRDTGAYRLKYQFPTYK